MRFTWGLLCLVFLPIQISLASPKVFFIVIDGVRDLEWKGEARDDRGARVKAESLFPNLTLMKKEGIFFDKMKISNPSRVSLPAYADMFTGLRQNKVIDNDPVVTKNPSQTIFDLASNQIGPEKVAVFASWKKICSFATSNDVAPFYQSCGWKKEEAMLPFIYEDSRLDIDTFISVSQYTKHQHPDFVFIHLGDADEEGHLHGKILKEKKVDVGISPYHEALRRSDALIGKLWQQVQKDDYYIGQTHFFITTDHGRDDSPKGQWAHHGRCLVCDGAEKVFAIVVGPQSKGKAVHTEFSHLDIFPTLAHALHLEFSESSFTKDMLQGQKNTRITKK